MADRLCTSVRPYKKGQSPIFGYFLPGTSTGQKPGSNRLQLEQHPASVPADFKSSPEWQFSHQPPNIDKSQALVSPYYYFYF